MRPRVKLRPPGDRWFPSAEAAVAWWARSRVTYPGQDPGRVSVHDGGTGAEASQLARVIVLLALSHLDGPDRAAFVAYACGLPVAKVARLLRRRRETVARRLALAREIVESRLRAGGLLGP